MVSSATPLEVPASVYEATAASLRDLDERNPDLQAIAELTHGAAPPAVLTHSDQEIALIGNPLGAFLVPVTVHGREYPFLLDTGAQTSAVTQTVWSDAGLGGTHTVSLRVGSHSGAERPMPFGLLSSLNLAGIAFGPMAVLVLLGATLDLRTGEGVVVQLLGVLGWDVLRLFDFEIVPDRGLLRVVGVPQSARRSKNFVSAAFPVVIGHGADRQPQFFGLDTGAKTSWLSRKLLDTGQIVAVDHVEIPRDGAHGPEMCSEAVVAEYTLSLSDVAVRFTRILTGFTDFVPGFCLDGVLGHDVLANRNVQFYSRTGLLGIGV
jgi:hypothetical protein